MSVQVSTRIDEATKQQFDKICELIGISPSNALSMFIRGVINHNGIPFNVVAQPENTSKIQKEAVRPPFEYGSINEKKPNAEFREAMEDIRLGRNLHGPFASVEDAMRSMLED
jgi:DNA-damage-inducible protein J